jgi:hypothetical protein
MQQETQQKICECGTGSHPYGKPMYFALTVAEAHSIVIPSTSDVHEPAPRTICDLKNHELDKSNQNG